MGKKKTTNKKAAKKVEAKQQAGAAASSPATPSSSSSSSLIPSVLVVVIAIAIGGGLHLNRGGLDATKDDAVSPTPKPNDTFKLSDMKPQPVVKEAPVQEVSIAFHHEIQPSLGDLSLRPGKGADAPSAAPTPVPSKEDAVVKKLRRSLMAYLQYDDGYASCLTKDSVDDVDLFGVLSLKRTKYEFLQKVANRPEFWTVRLPPNANKAGGDELKAAAERLESMCRFMTLTHEDYSGRAPKVLKDFVAKDSFDDFSVKNQGLASDYRTAVCLHRLTDAEYAKEPTSRDGKLAKAALGTLRYAWVEKINELKEGAMSAPSRPMPEGWSEHREEDNGHTYYMNTKTGKTYWIRPVPLYGAKGVVTDPPPPAKNGKAMLGSIVARKKPCPLKDTLGIIEE